MHKFRTGKRGNRLFVQILKSCLPSDETSRGEPDDQNETAMFVFFWRKPSPEQV